MLINITVNGEQIDRRRLKGIELKSHAADMVMRDVMKRNEVEYKGVQTASESTIGRPLH